MPIAAGNRTEEEENLSIPDYGHQAAGNVMGTSRQWGSTEG